MSAVFPDGFADGDVDEAIQLWNAGAATADLSGWSVDDGEGSAGFPPGSWLPPGTWWWLARDAAAFGASFGHSPDWSWGGASVVGVGAMVARAGGLGLANRGDEVLLRRDDGALADAMAFSSAAAPVGWSGPTVQPYRTSALSAAHQVLYRKLDPAGGRPVDDTDSAVDWASDIADSVLGRRVRYPGWDLESRFQPVAWREAARLEVAVAPDALHGFLRRHIDAAQLTLDVFAYTIDNPDLAEAVAARAAAGVQVRVLLDGDPAGGVDLSARWCAARMAASGASVYWMDAAGGIGARYRNAHAKLYLVDERVAIVSTENPGLGAAPYDDLLDGTLGRRGAAVAVRAPTAVSWIAGLIDSDLDEAHTDIRPYQARDPVRGEPAPDFAPPRGGGGAGYTPVAPIPWTGDGTFAFEGISSPENSLHPNAGLFGLLKRAGSGARVDVAQLYEQATWGSGAMEGPWPNPRLEAYVAAARRGARVRILLDSHFDDPAGENSNRAAATWLNRLAAQEGLDLSARRGDPTGGGIHAKIVLVRLAGSRGASWVHIGSLNGSETSSKANREVAIQIEGAGLHGYLAAVFGYDWAASAFRRAHLPTLNGRVWLRR